MLTKAFNTIQDANIAISFEAEAAAATAAGAAAAGVKNLFSDAFFAAIWPDVFERTTLDLAKKKGENKRKIIKEVKADTWLRA